MEKYKILRVLCMFDLPVETEEERRAYRIFRKNLPAEGNVRLLCVTEKQYTDMKLLVGSRSASETAIGTERLIII